jgi:predicted TIM-barrel fold metal-dependent hydrolase
MASGSLSPPPSDSSYDPYYKLCIEAGIPVLIFVGTTGLGRDCRAAAA